MHVLLQNWCLNSIISSKQAAALKLDNLRQTMVLYKTGKLFQASMAVKFENKKTNCTEKTFELS